MIAGDHFLVGNRGWVVSLREKAASCGGRERSGTFCEFAKLRVVIFRIKVFQEFLRKGFWDLIVVRSLHRVVLVFPSCIRGFSISKKRDGFVKT